MPDKSGPIAKLEQIVSEALTRIGMSKGEALVVIERLEAFGAKAHAAPVIDGSPAGDQQDAGNPRQGSVNRDSISFSNVYCRARTDLALLCEIEGLDIWIPRSQIITAYSKVIAKGDYGKLTVTRWIAQEKGLI